MPLDIGILSAQAFVNNAQTSLNNADFLVSSLQAKLANFNATPINTQTNVTPNIPQYNSPVQAPVKLPVQMLIKRQTQANAPNITRVIETAPGQPTIVTIPQTTGQTHKSVLSGGVIAAALGLLTILIGEKK